jgi:gamma-glutamylputrescine oxidase
VVVATDGYTHGLVPALDAAIAPARGQVVATEPLRERLFDMPHYARDGYDYWQQLADGRIVLGGWRDVALEAETTREETVTPAIQDRIEDFLALLVGHTPRITHRWAGIFGVTESRLPFVGPVPGDGRVWVSAGYSGHGNVLGFACGTLVGRAVAGEDVPELELFDRLS